MHRDPVLLSIGSGRTVPEGWLGIDRKVGPRVFNFDLRFTLPLADASVGGILCEHILEHFTLDDLPRMLKDYRRMLVPGGGLRIASPDALLIASLIRGDDDERTKRQLDFDADIHRWIPTDPMLRWRVANRMAYQFGQHHTLLSAELMARLLEQSGFSQIRSVKVWESDYFGVIPTTHFDRFPAAEHEVFVVEAVKPDSSLDPGAVP